MLVHDARAAPFPEGVPAQTTGLTGDADQIECPRRMRITRSISGNRGLSNGYRQATNFGHDVKRDEKVEKNRAHPRLPSDRSFPGVATYLDFVRVKGVKDFKILFEA